VERWAATRRCSSQERFRQRRGGAMDRQLISGGGADDNVPPRAEVGVRGVREA
jgi:hypothetical protein